MNRIWGQSQTVLRKHKMHLIPQECTSAGRCGSFLAAFYVLCSSVLFALGNTGSFI